MNKKIISTIVITITLLLSAIYFLLRTSNTARKISPPHVAIEAPNPPAASVPIVSETPEFVSSSPQATPAYEVDAVSKISSQADLVVPRGARVPAVLMDAGGPDDSAETRDIMNGIIEEFAEKIELARKENRNIEEAWEKAREEADDRYRFFFGFEAFNAATLEAAGDAVEEANSLQQMPGNK